MRTVTKYYTTVVEFQTFGGATGRSDPSGKLLHLLVVVVLPDPCYQFTAEEAILFEEKFLLHQRLAALSWLCSPHPSPERWAEIEKQISAEIRPTGRLPIVWKRLPSRDLSVKGKTTK